MVNETKRISWIDTFRTLMIFCVALGHSLHVKEPVGAVLNDYVHTFHVAGFFFVSGYLFSTKKIGFLGFLKKKFFSLMVPYYFFAIISLSIFLVMGGVASAKLGIELSGSGILKNILGILYANGLTGYMKWNLPMWFVPCLFITSIIFYFIVKLIAVLEKRTSFHISIFSTMGIILVIDIINYYGLSVKYLPFGLEVSGYMLPVMLLGFWCKRTLKIDSLTNKAKFITGILLLVVGGVLLIFIGSSISFVSSIYGNIFVFYLSCVINILGYMLLSGLIDCRVFNYVGKNTLVILALHKFPIVFMQLFLKQYMTSWVLNIVIGVAMTIISIVLSLVCGEILSRTVPFVLGKKKKVKL